MWGSIQYKQANNIYSDEIKNGIDRIVTSPEAARGTPSPGEICANTQCMVPLVYQSPQKWHHCWFSHFSTAHGCDRQTDHRSLITGHIICTQCSLLAHKVDTQITDHISDEGTDKLPCVCTSISFHSNVWTAWVLTLIFCTGKVVATAGLWLKMEVIGKGQG